MPQVAVRTGAVVELDRIDAKERIRSVRSGCRPAREIESIVGKVAGKQRGIAALAAGRIVVSITAEGSSGSEPEKSRAAERVKPHVHHLRGTGATVDPSDRAPLIILPL